MLKKLHELACYRFSNERVGYYWHILVSHLPELLRKWGSLQPYSQQGVEAHHQLAESVEKRATSRGGKVSKKKIPTDALLQIFLYPLRLLACAATVEGATWTLRRARQQRCDRNTVSPQLVNMMYIYSNQEDTENPFETELEELDLDIGSEGDVEPDLDSEETDTIEDSSQPSSNSLDTEVRENMERFIKYIIDKSLMDYRYSSTVESPPVSIRLGENTLYPPISYTTTEVTDQQSIMDEEIELLDPRDCVDEFVEEVSSMYETDREVSPDTREILGNHPVDGIRFTATQQSFQAVLYNTRPTNDILQQIRIESMEW